MSPTCHGLLEAGKPPAAGAFPNGLIVCYRFIPNTHIWTIEGTFRLKQIVWIKIDLNVFGKCIRFSYKKEYTICVKVTRYRIAFYKKGYILAYRITHWHEYIKQNLFVGTFLKSPLSSSSDAFGILIGGDRVHASSSKHACGQIFADKSVYTMYDDIANEGMAGKQWKCFYFVCGVLSACLQWFKFSMLWLPCDQLVKQ